MIELLVVVAIIAVLAALSLSAISQFLAAQQDRVSETTIRKVMTELDKHVKAVLDQANKEPIPSSVFTAANTADPQVARVYYLKYRLEQEFPSSASELNPANVVLPPKKTYQNALASNQNPNPSSIALLLLALQQGRGGHKFSAEETLGSTALAGTDNLKEIVDAKGNPLQVLRTITVNTTTKKLQIDEIYVKSVGRDLADPNDDIRGDTLRQQGARGDQ